MVTGSLKPLCNIDSPSSLCCVGRAVEDGSSGLKSNKKTLRESESTPDKRDAAWFKHEIAPKLDVLPVKADRQGNGFIARGLLAHPRWQKLPHPRH
jgi:hypothetical protein